MIASVYPIKRMPRRMAAFDYRIPNTLSVARGNLVEVPFRNQQLFGVVRKTKNKPPRGIDLKNVQAVRSEMKMASDEVAFFEEMAVDLAQSVPSVLHAAIPTPPKRGSGTVNTPDTDAAITVPTREMDSVAHVVHQMRKRRHSFVATPDLRRMTALVAGYAKQQPDDIISIILPNVRDAELVATHLSHLDPLLITGAESNNTRFATWRAFRERNHRVLVGTRITALLPHPEIDALFILRSTHKNHRQADRNPRYDGRIAAWKLHEQFHSKLFFLDTAPRVDDFARFTAPNRLTLKNKSPVTLVSMPKERPTAPHPAIGSTTIGLIEDARADGERVLCIYNKKGGARRLRCQNCPHQFDCSGCGGVLVVYERSLRCHRCGHKEITPSQCPGCGGNAFVRTGFGNRAIRDALQDLFPDATVVISEKGSNAPTVDADIILATSHYFENVFSPFRPTPFGLVVQLDADLALYEPSFRAFERAVYDLASWHGLAHANNYVPFCVQTHETDLFASFLKKPAARFEKELEMRIAYHQPPARRWMRVHYRHKERRKAEHAIHSVITDLRASIPDVIIYGPENAQPDGLQIEVAVTNEHIDDVLAYFANLDDKYIIDTYAFGG